LEKRNQPKTIPLAMLSEKHVFALAMDERLASLLWQSVNGDPTTAYHELSQLETMPEFHTALAVGCVM
jgi:hypothetical protein